VSVAQGVERTSFSIIHGNRQAARFAHPPQQKAIVVAIAEDGNGCEIESFHKVSLPKILPFLFQHVWDRDSSELLVRRSVGIGGDDGQFDPLR